jgi:hypothetical protein
MRKVRSSGDLENFGRDIRPLLGNVLKVITQKDQVSNFTGPSRYCLIKMTTYDVLVHPENCLRNFMLFVGTWEMINVTLNSNKCSLFSLPAIDIKIGDAVQAKRRALIETQIEL